MSADPKATALARELIEQIEVACDEFGLVSLQKNLTGVKNFASQNQYLDVAVIGEFKAGKSSFINSFIGTDAVPVGSIPVTSMITRIAYGATEKAVISFADGCQKEIPLQEIAEYVAESENPGNEKHVLFADAYLPSLQRLKDLRLVDTPGTGSIWRHNTETAQSWFPETGAVLLVISAERPISASEMELIREVRRYSPEVAVILAKTDLFSEAQLGEIESFTQAALQKEFGKSIRIFRYSIHQNTAACNARVEAEYFTPLIGNREQVYGDILRHKTRFLAEQCLSYLNIAYQASLQQESEREKLRERVIDEHLNSHFIRRELQLILDSYKSDTREGIRKYLDEYRSEITGKILQNYAVAAPEWTGNLYRVTRQFEAWLRAELTGELQAILQGEDKTSGILTGVQKHFSFYLKSFRERLNDNLAKTLGVTIKGEAWEVTLREFQKPDISISRTFDFHLDLLWFLLPMAIFGKLFRRYFSGQIPYEVEKNLHRLTSGLTEKVYKEMDALLTQTQGYIREELNTVEGLLAGDQSPGGEMASIMEVLRERAGRL